MSDKAHFEKTVLLSVGHVAVVIAGFLVPVFLSRHLTIEDYGSYKQLILIYVFLMLVGHMGMDNGLFYFIKSHPGREGIFSFNAMRFDTALAAALAFALVALRSPLATAFHNPALADALPLFAIFVLFSIPAQHFEHYLSVLDEIKGAILLGVAYEGIKAAVIVGGFYYFDSLEAVFAGLAVLAFLKFSALFAFNVRRVQRSGLGRAEAYAFAQKVMPEQVRYGVPQGAKNLIGAFLKLDKFVISAMFPVRLFTIYAVGCFEVPLIGSVSNTMTDLMSFEMVAANRAGDSAKVKQLWHSTIRKVSLFQVPIVVYLFCFADVLIPFLFSETYRESARYFEVFSLTLLLTGFSPEILYRVFAKTGLILRYQAWAALYTIALVIGWAFGWGPMGALVGKLVSDGLTLGLYSQGARRLMGLGWRDYLPWGQIAGITAVSAALAAASRWAWPQLISTPFWLLAVSSVAYTVAVFLVCVPTGLIKEDETAYLKAKLIGRKPE